MKIESLSINIASLLKARLLPLPIAERINVEYQRLLDKGVTKTELFK